MTQAFPTLTTEESGERVRLRLSGFTVYGLVDPKDGRYQAILDDHLTGEKTDLGTYARPADAMEDLRNALLAAAEKKGIDVSSLRPPA